MYLTYLKDLVAFNSVTPKSNGAIEYVRDVLKKHGFKTEIKVFGDSNGEVTNLYALHSNREPNICFVGHVDVVPAGDCHLWHNADPFKAHEEAGKIYGRGTVDMKGAIACFLAAALDVINKNNHAINGSVSFLLTSDEEGVAKHGTREMLQYMHDQGHTIDFAIVGEPTCEKEIGDTIKIGRRGSVNFKLSVKGLAGHVAYPQKAKNPLPCLVKILHELTNVKLDAGTEFFQSSNLEVTNVDVGNSATNVIPGEARAYFNVRFNNLQTAETLGQYVESVVKKYCKEFTVEYKLECDVTAECFIQKPNDRIKMLADVVEGALKVKPEFSTSGGTSDARFVKNYCYLVEFGLLSDQAHKVNEHTKVSDLQKLYDVYYNFLICLLTDRKPSYLLK